MEREHLNGKAKPGKPKRPKRRPEGHMDRPVDGDTMDPGRLHRNLDYRSKTATEDVTALTKSYPHEDAAVLAHSTKIRNSYQRTVEAIVETGHLLIAAKDALGHGKFGLMFRYLPFGQRQGEMLMDIAKHPILGNSQYFANLPQSWATLHKLAGLTAEQVKTRIDDRHINPAMTMREAKLIGSSNGTHAKWSAVALIGELHMFTSYTKPQELIDYHHIAQPAVVNALAKWLAEWASLSEAYAAQREAEMEDACNEYLARSKREEKDKPKTELGWERQAREDKARAEFKEIWELMEEARQAGDHDEVEQLSKRLAALPTGK